MTTVVQTLIEDIQRLTRDLEIKTTQLGRALEMKVDGSDADIVLCFDGGVKPGHAYGSYRIGVGDIVRMRHGGAGVTSNQAEYLTLLAGLNALSAQVRPENHAITLVGDSKLVLNQISGIWECRHIRLIPLRDAAIEALSEYRSWKAEWVPREAIVKVFGH